MTNDLLDKLIKKINFEHANNFELAVAKEYSFVPINVQGDSFFVAVSPDADKEKIIEYIKPIVDKKVEFIFLSKQNFDTLFEGFLKKFSSTFGSVLSDETANNPFGDVAFEAQDSSRKEPKDDTVVHEIDDDELNFYDEDDSIDISEDSISLDDDEDVSAPSQDTDSTLLTQDNPDETEQDVIQEKKRS